MHSTRTSGTLNINSLLCTDSIVYRVQHVWVCIDYRVCDRPLTVRHACKLSVLKSRTADRSVLRYEYCNGVLFETCGLGTAVCVCGLGTLASGLGPVGDLVRCAGLHCEVISIDMTQYQLFQ
jgi:hypothetical protein